MLPLVLVVGLIAQQTAAPPSPLEAQLRHAIAASGAEVAVAFLTIDGRDEVLIDPDKSFHAASTMKVAVMVELFNQAKSGVLSLGDAMPIRNEFRSIVDGSRYSLSEGDDSDKAIYAAAGKTLTLKQLCEAMITVSSNFATNLLIEKLGVDNIRRTVTRLGGDVNGGLQVLRGVEDSKAFEKGLNNSTTARGLMVVLDKLARGQAVDEASDAQMIEILKRQTFKDGIPAGLPRNTPVAHKTGNITRIHHDAGIVYGRRPYVLVVLVRGVDDRKKSGALIAELSRLVFENTRPRQPVLP
jgi:beta-lactamase class A